jgi:hypothetical protein
VAGIAAAAAGWLDSLLPFADAVAAVSHDALDVRVRSPDARGDAARAQAVSHATILSLRTGTMRVGDCHPGRGWWQQQQATRETVHAHGCAREVLRVATARIVAQLNMPHAVINARTLCDACAQLMQVCFTLADAAASRVPRWSRAHAQVDRLHGCAHTFLVRHEEVFSGTTLWYAREVWLAMATVPEVRPCARCMRGDSLVWYRACHCAAAACVQMLVEEWAQAGRRVRLLCAEEPPSAPPCGAGVLEVVNLLDALDVSPACHGQPLHAEAAQVRARVVAIVRERMGAW